MTEHPHAHIIAQHRAAARDAERYWDGDDPADDYTPEDGEPMTVQPDDCSCGRCLGCAIRRMRAEKREAWTWLDK